jgi:hypothetical protein
MSTREFPETDTTNWVIRTKSAELSASGTHEIIASFESKINALWFAKEILGPRWRRTYEVKART